MLNILEESKMQYILSVNMPKLSNYQVFLLHRYQPLIVHHISEGSEIENYYSLGHDSYLMQGDNVIQADSMITCDSGILQPYDRDRP